jgi:hypothetical protein
MEGDIEGSGRVSPYTAGPCPGPQDAGRSAPDKAERGSGVPDGRRARRQAQEKAVILRLPPQGAYSGQVDHLFRTEPITLPPLPPKTFLRPSEGRFRLSQSGLTRPKECHPQVIDPSGIADRPLRNR